MAFIEDARTWSKNMKDPMVGQVNTVLYEIQDAVKKHQQGSGLTIAQVRFLKPCTTVVAVDANKVYIVGSNKSAGGMQRIYYFESKSIFKDITSVYQTITRDIGLEQLFGIELPRDVLEMTDIEMRRSYADTIASLYIADEIKEHLLAMKLVKMIPIFSGRGFMIDDNLIFCLSPFKEPYNCIYPDHICKAVSEVNNGLYCLRADNIFDNRPIMEDIWANINKARIIISDLSEKNPNVFYETGLAHTVGKEVILITQSMDDVPFDLKHLRCILYEYNPRGMVAFEDKLKATIKTVLDR